MRIYGEYFDGVLSIQPRKYIEDGWYIELHKKFWEVWEIPPGGGKPVKLDYFDEFPKAINYATGLR